MADSSGNPGVGRENTSPAPEVGGKLGLPSTLNGEPIKPIAVIATHNFVSTARLLWDEDVPPFVVDWHLKVRPIRSSSDGMAVIAQASSPIATEPCGHCAKGSGAFRVCTVLEGWTASCNSCQLLRIGGSCSFVNREPPTPRIEQETAANREVLTKRDQALRLARDARALGLRVVPDTFPVGLFDFAPGRKVTLGEYPFSRVPLPPSAEQLGVRSFWHPMDLYEMNAAYQDAGYDEEDLDAGGVDSASKFNEAGEHLDLAWYHYCCGLRRLYVEALSVQGLREDELPKASEDEMALAMERDMIRRHIGDRYAPVDAAVDNDVHPVSSSDGNPDESAGSSKGSDANSQSGDEEEHYQESSSVITTGNEEANQPEEDLDGRLASTGSSGDDIPAGVPGSPSVVVEADHSVELPATPASPETHDKRHREGSTISGKVLKRPKIVGSPAIPPSSPLGTRGVGQKDGELCVADSSPEIVRAPTAIQLPIRGSPSSGPPMPAIAEANDSAHPAPAPSQAIDAAAIDEARRAKRRAKKQRQKVKRRQEKEALAAAALEGAGSQGRPSAD